MSKLLSLFTLAAMASASAMAYDQANDSFITLDQTGVQQAEVTPITPPSYDAAQPVYRPADCIGAVVNGVCHGAVTPDAQIRQPVRCYGQMLNGQCTGPQF